MEAFSAFLAAHGGDSDNVVEVVCDMSQAFLSGVAEHLPKLDEVRKKERREQGHPKLLRWALLKNRPLSSLTLSS
ncbi:MAG: transposase [Halomonas sp.]|nr:transposase [Halomonas sp.]